MKKICMLLFVVLTTAVVAFAQDVIIMKNGDEVKAKVTEINIDEIKYKRADNPDGPVITVAKNTVFMIKYENGTKEMITSSVQNQSTNNQKIADKVKSYEGLFFASLSIPTGNFADQYGGAAKMGFGIGHQGMVSLGSSNVYFNYEVSFNHNSYKAEFVDFYYGYNFILEGSYNLINTLVGIRVQGAPSNSVIYGNFLIGANFASVTGDIADAGYSNATGFGYSAGFGVIASKHLNIGFSYFGSQPKFNSDQNGAMDVEQKINMIKVIIGYQF